MGSAYDKWLEVSLDEDDGRLLTAIQEVAADWQKSNDFLQTEINSLVEKNGELEVWLHNQNQAVKELVEQLEVKNQKNSEMQSDVILLRCLEMGGVDNWSGYGSHTFDLMKEYYPEEYKRRFGDE